MIVEEHLYCPECQKNTGGRCAKHLVTFTSVGPPVNVTLNPFPFVPQGWQCPLCRNVFAPHVSSCGCANTVSVYTTTTTSSGTA